jgi:nucleotide-binding universal stress UspA family protein
MSVKVIVSYDGTANEDDAIALGRRFADAGAEVSLAYVRHTHEPDRDRETLVDHEAQELLQRGASVFGEQALAGLDVVTDRSTPEGLRKLAEQRGADVIVFCSDSHTAKGHVSIGNSAQRLLEGGRSAIAIAPAGLAETASASISRVVAVGDSDGGALASAEALARAVGASVEPVADENTDLLVIDSRPETERGEVSLSSSAEHLIEGARSSVLVVPRAVVLEFGRTPAPLTA